MNLMIYSAMAMIALAALVVNIVLVCLQKKHNRNSIRPICSIHQTNYDNFISARIENDGIGSARVISIKWKDKEGKNLPDILLEKLDQKNYHRITPLSNEKYTISANKKLFLLAITPRNDGIRKQLRAILHNSSLEVTYLDIYDGKFSCKLCLNFRNNNVGATITDHDKFHLWS